MAGRDPGFAGGRPDEPPAGTPATPAIVIVLVAAIRGECRRVAAKPFRLLPSRRLRVHRSCCRLRYGMHADEMRRTSRANEQAIAHAPSRNCQQRDIQALLWRKRLRTRDRSSPSERLT